MSASNQPHPRSGNSKSASRLRCAGVAIILLAVLLGCAGSDPDRADGLEDRLQETVDKFLADRSVPGVSVAVIVDEDLYRVVGGFADVEARRKVVVDDEFRLASVTKNYVAALAGDLSHDGVLGLDDTVDRWIPDVPASLARVRDVTLRQLLSHTSGLAQTYTDDQDRGRVLSTDDVLARIPPSACEPGRCWSYADGNYLVAGLILEAATGATIADAIEEHFLEPLGLTHTHFISTGPTDVVPQYILASDETGKTVLPHEFRRQLLPVHANDAAGGMQASASDLARWGDALFRARATPSGVVRTLLDSDAMRNLPCPDGCPYPYGLGVFHYTMNGEELVGHDGSSGAVLGHELDRATTIAIATNGGEQDSGALLRLILEELDTER
jgi:CubicO group peptidase (beta-lactamase class C family)